MPYHSSDVRWVLENEVALVSEAIRTRGVTVLTLALMLIQARGLNEAWFAAAGALGLLVASTLPLCAPAHAVADIADVLASTDVPVPGSAAGQIIVGVSMATIASNVINNTPPRFLPARCSLRCHTGLAR